MPKRKVTITVGDLNVGDTFQIERDRGRWLVIEPPAPWVAHCKRQNRTVCVHTTRSPASLDEATAFFVNEAIVTHVKRARGKEQEFAEREWIEIRDTSTNRLHFSIYCAGFEDGDKRPEFTIRAPSMYHRLTARKHPMSKRHFRPPYRLDEIIITRSVGPRAKKAKS